jgi:hypothetical protein
MRLVPVVGNVSPARHVQLRWEKRDKWGKLENIDSIYRAYTVMTGKGCEVDSKDDGVSIQ